MRVRFSKDHVYITVEDDLGTVGITIHAQEKLSDVTFVGLPRVGQEVKKGGAVGVVESVKAASDLYSPVSGEILGVNEALKGKPELVNEDAEGAGWIFKIKITEPSEVRVSFQVTRHEDRVMLDTHKATTQPELSPELRRFLQPDRRVRLDGVIADLSAQETKGLEDPLAKARAIYNYVIATMRYDKSGTGWGNGDAIWACTAKRGNCTDFHSLFIGMMRAAGIPARFEIGFPLPSDQHDGAVPGYHCWAEFYVQPYGWVPVDASEAWKHPDKKDYFFGALDDNRLQVTVGRDIRLNPPQQGDPLNYFVYPYAELDGKPIALESRFSFQDRN